MYVLCVRMENSSNPNQMARQKPANLDVHCVLFQKRMDSRSSR